jgi:hypothetical protein
MMTPWQVGFVSECVRALARDDRAAMARWVLRPSFPSRLFSNGVDRMARLAGASPCREALAPWRDDSHPGPRTYRIRTAETTTLARFGEHEHQVLVLVIVQQGNGDVKLEDIRAMDRSDFESFGEVV